jgi:hypothetical protein
MDKLDRALLTRVEKALNLTLKDWQVNYILDIPMVLDMRITGRRTGKTLAYVIKLLFLKDTPIKAYDMFEISRLADDYHDLNNWKKDDNHYNRWFQNYLVDIYNCLISAGIKTRPVFLSEIEYEHYQYQEKVRFWNYD